MQHSSLIQIILQLQIPDSHETAIDNAKKIFCISSSSHESKSIWRQLSFNTGSALTHLNYAVDNQKSHHRTPNCAENDRSSLGFQGTKSTKSRRRGHRGIRKFRTPKFSSVGEMMVFTYEKWKDIRKQTLELSESLTATTAESQRRRIEVLFKRKLQLDNLSERCEEAWKYMNHLILLSSSFEYRTSVSRSVWGCSKRMRMSLMDEDMDEMRLFVFSRYILGAL
ncbi:hypothetical protein F5Y19DRAFT_447593 [Xylariaceae sp. FL1651]|nr:hypothetical protein F5Y19DRAFT_447593 [Xylariaceae sp. FL1651]